MTKTGTPLALKIGGAMVGLFIGFIASSYAVGRFEDRFRQYWLRHPQLGEAVGNISFIGNDMEKDYKNDIIVLQSVSGLAGTAANPPTFEEWK